MKLTTRKLGGGFYRVLVDGLETDIVIEKGEPPKFGLRQDWHIGIWNGPNEHPTWLSYDQNGKHGALHTVASILCASKISKRQIAA
jgi:hypothetical protein